MKLTEEERGREVRPLSDLRRTGLLWLINATVFHPRGFALGFVFGSTGLVGWRLLGDGSEPWRFDDDTDESFAAAEALFAEHRRAAVDALGDVTPRSET